MNESLDALRQAALACVGKSFTLRDEANAIVAYAFRTGPIEELHAGVASDLLANPELSRITDEEMKRIMIAACQAVERLLREKHADPGAYYLKMMDYGHRYCRGWDRGESSTN
jgi:hypothetical protein